VTGIVVPAKLMVALRVAKSLRSTKKLIDPLPLPGVPELNFSQGAELTAV
jgi:hypothetical protein